MRGDAAVRKHVLPEDLKRGARVFVPRLRAEGEVLEVSSAGQVRVAVGANEALRHEGQTAVGLPRPAPPRRARGAPRGTATAHGYDGNAHATAPIQTQDNTCDLRGLYADDAVAMATAFLDRSIGEGRGVAFLVHGHGTGALRESIRRSSRRARTSATSARGKAAKGGRGHRRLDRVTHVVATGRASSATSSRAFTHQRATADYPSSS